MNLNAIRRRMIALGHTAAKVMNLVLNTESDTVLQYMLRRRGKGWGGERLEIGQNGRQATREQLPRKSGSVPGEEEDSCRAWQKQQWVSQAGDIWQTQEAGEGACWWIKNWHMSPREGGAGMAHTEYWLVRKKNLKNWRAPQWVLGHQKSTFVIGLPWRKTMW